jgi:arylsulfatase A-like enzyme
VRGGPSLAQLVDIYPTIQELLNLRRPADAPKLAGLSVVPVLTESKPTGRAYAISENWSQVSVIAARYKLGVWIDPTSRNAQRDYRRRFSDMLFDREKDPQELVNFAGKPGYAAVEGKLREYLAEWVGCTPNDGKKALSATPVQPKKKSPNSQK